MKINRRTFFRTAGAGIATGALIPLHPLASMLNTTPRLSVQLYTVREAIENDLEGTIRRIADLGFKYVETAFWPKGVTLEKASAVIREAGLKVSSCHVELPLGDQRAVFEQTAKAFECTKMIWHGWPEDKRYSTTGGTRELISVYNQAASHARSMGLSFGLHNHWWEFRNMIDGKLVYEFLLQETDPSIFFEIDTYWVKVAGLDPAEIIRRFAARAKLLHMKDGPALYHDKLAEDHIDPMTAVGKGAQNIPSIVKEATYAEFLVIEMDKVAGDVFSLVGESYRYLNRQFGLK